MSFGDVLREFATGFLDGLFGTNLSATTPPNTLRDGNSLKPRPGYQWVNPRPGDYTVQWTPGTIWGEKHLQAGEAVGQWGPAPGYAWIAPQDPESCAVAWKPGKEVPGKHIVAAEREGGWRPASGYSWTHPDLPGSFEVHWTPGRFHNTAPHVIAAVREGCWEPEEGFRWVSPNPSDQDLRVEPDRPHTNGHGHEGRSQSVGPDLQRLKDLATLGLDDTAGHSDIEMSFRRLVRIHHPDRYASQGAQALADAHKAFLLLRSAYERLTGSRAS